MKKTLLLAIVAFTFASVLSGCSAENKVEKLQQEKEAKLESSGYNACIAKIEEREKAQEQCKTDKLAEAGYTDGVDCIECGGYYDIDFSTGEKTYYEGYEQCTICDTARYNAQVNANNECLEEFKDPSALTQFDCAELLQ